MSKSCALTDKARAGAENHPGQHEAKPEAPAARCGRAGAGIPRRDKVGRVRSTSGIAPVVLGHAASLFLAIVFMLCVLFDLAFQGHAMYEAWSKLFPGFEWISWRSYLVGLAESYGYGWFFGLLWAGLYNFFVARAEASVGKRSNADGAVEQMDPSTLPAERVVTVMWHGKPVLIRTADTLGG